MKKNLIIAMLMSAVVLSSCDINMTELDDPALPDNIIKSGKTFKGEFEAIWHALDIGYLFWDVDTTNWDQRYYQMMSLGERLDSVVPYNGLLLQDSLAIRDLFVGLIDHHMIIYIVNPYAHRDNRFLAFKPSLTEIRSRDYYREEIPYKALKNSVIKTSEQFGITDSLSDSFLGSEGSTINTFYCLLEGGVAYFSLTDYFLSESVPANEAFAYNKWIDTIVDLKQKGQLKGIILDNRGNPGGYLTDNYYVTAPFIQAEEISVYMSRDKNGLGRYDYSEWDIGFIDGAGDDFIDVNDIPFVVLQSLYSQSMGEITTSVLTQYVKSTYIIGERTNGATSTLMYQSYEKNHYSGMVNICYDEALDNEWFIYTASSLCKIWNWQTQDYDVMEGKGITPMKEVLIHPEDIEAGNDKCLIEAMNYIHSKTN